MPTAVQIEEFLSLSSEFPFFDVRSPAEFDHGHIPGAISFPLFNNQERATIGTLYKQKGKEEAIKIGLELVGPKLRAMAEFASEKNKKNTFLVHCWRGGMRSTSVGTFLEFCGYKTYTLKGGYKFFRKWALRQLEVSRNLIVLGGKTGSGKTDILKELEKKGEQVIDLEGIAHHKGSSFGALGEEKQPTQEQFENSLAFLLSKTDPQKPLWVEDESRLIGSKVLPNAFWNQLRCANVICIDVSPEERIRYLSEAYGKFPEAEIKQALERIGNRLGGQHLKTGLEALQQKDVRKVCEICLVYYDKAYNYGIDQRDPKRVFWLRLEKINGKENAEKIFEASKKIKKI